jgi:hypothetical protein
VGTRTSKGKLQVSFLVSNFSHTNFIKALHVPCKTCNHRNQRAGRGEAEMEGDRRWRRIRCILRHTRAFTSQITRLCRESSRRGATGGAGLVARPPPPSPPTLAVPVPFFNLRGHVMGERRGNKVKIFPLSLPSPPTIPLRPLLSRALAHSRSRSLALSRALSLSTGETKQGRGVR